MTLEELLASRDRRRDMQRRLMERHQQETLLVLTVVMPGPSKQTRASAIVAEAGVRALEEVFASRIGSRLLRDLRTGFEAYLTIGLPADEVKRRAVEIEENHPLGRLMDIDVIASDGRPMSRGSQRTCLLCDRPAHECMRARTHSVPELLRRIDSLCDEFVQQS